MIDLENNKFSREIPANLLKDKRVVNIARSLQVALDVRMEWRNRINYTMNLEDLPDAILDHLLWEKHITWYEGLALIQTREQKIRFIRNAIMLHRLKGTPAAIELVFSLLDIDARLREWFEYGGNPYRFKVEVMNVSEQGLNEETMHLLEKLVLEYKNVRSNLDAINIYFTSKNKHFVHSAHRFGEEITIYPYSVKNIEVRGVAHLGTAQAVVDTTVIYPKGVGNT